MYICQSQSPNSFYLLDVIKSQPLTPVELDATGQSHVMRPIVSYINWLLASGWPGYIAVCIWQTITLPLSTMMISNLQSLQTSNINLFFHSYCITLPLTSQNKQKSADLKSFTFPPAFTLSSFILIITEEPYFSFISALFPSLFLTLTITPFLSSRFNFCPNWIIPINLVSTVESFPLKNKDTFS